jgi:hypothetical protein
MQQLAGNVRSRNESVRPLGFLLRHECIQLVEQRSRRPDKEDRVHRHSRAQLFAASFT